VIPPLAEEDTERSILERLARVAAALPEAPALVLPGRTLSYAALARESGRLARAILAARAARDEAAALLVPFASEVPALLGALLAGRAYGALDPSAPDAALEAAAATIAPGVIVTTEALRPRAHRLGAEVVLLPSGEAPDEPPDPAPDEAARAGPDDVASIIVTSGSTGAPKGVERSHRAILHRARLFARDHAVGPGDRVALLHSCRFGAAEVDVMGALLSGAALVPYDARAHGFLPLGDWLGEQGITHVHPPIPILRRLLHLRREPLRAPRLRLVALGGEPLFAADAALCARLLPRGARLEHRFSATETGPIAARLFDPAEPVEGPLVPVGRPVDGRRVLLLDAEGRPVPEGEVGEVVVLGRTMARGYRGDPEATRARFEGAPGSPDRRCRTGDLARRLPSGELVYEGRGDRLVKVRGQRVSLSLVEAALLAGEGVTEAAAVLAADASGEARVEAFIAGRAADPDEVRRALRRRLPDAMVPGRVVRLAAIPLTASGKLDRAALERAAPANAPAAATEGSIAAVWAAVLDRPTAAPDEDFFASGGDSLLAAELCARVSLRIGRPVHVSVLAGAPTLAAFTAALEVPAAPAGARIVTLASGGAGLPLFCVHGLDGGVGPFTALARRLAGSHPVHALTIGDVEGRAPAPGSIEAMAGRYLAEMRAARPRGPYALLGYCMGGVVALEIARRLLAEGERVVLLAIADLRRAPSLSARDSLGRALSDALLRRRRVAAHAALDLIGAPIESPLFGALARGVEALRPRRSPGGPAAARVDGLLARVADALRGAERVVPPVEAALQRARHRYVARGGYAGRVLLVTPQGGAPTRREAARWRRLARGGVDRLSVPGDHMSMLAEPHVAELARGLRARLEAAAAPLPEGAP